MIGHTLAAFALVLAQATTTPTPPRPCFTPDEAGAGAAVMLPEMVNMLKSGCERHLPPDAYLQTSGTELVQRWRTESAPQRRTAMGLMRMIPPQAMQGMAQGNAAAASLPPSGAAAPSPAAMMPQMLQQMQGAMASKLNPMVCKEASRLIEALAPLPAENIAQLFSALLGIGVAVMPAKGEDGPPICRR